MNGIIIIDKPTGYTSFDVIAIMRKLTKQKKIGHTGTLDPMATGVLPILLGKATKAQSLIPDENKEYLASFQLGITSDTQDRTGKILHKSTTSVSSHDILKNLEFFMGDIYQVPPMYSAVSKNGVRLYTLARQGIEMERTPRKIHIDSIKLVKFDETAQNGQLIINCSKGTYIRTLCHDLGIRLNCGAVMTALRRTKACGFSISESISLELAKKLSANNSLNDFVLPIDRLFYEYKKINISQAQTIRFQNGGSLDLKRICVANLFENELVRVYDPNDKFIALGKNSINTGELLPVKNFS